jgi:hypothetical protein
MMQMNTGTLTQTQIQISINYLLPDYGTIVHLVALCSRFRISYVRGPVPSRKRVCKCSTIVPGISLASTTVVVYYR